MKPQEFFSDAVKRLLEHEARNLAEEGKAFEPAAALQKSTYQERLLHSMMDRVRFEAYDKRVKRLKRMQH